MIERVRYDHGLSMCWVVQGCLSVNYHSHRRSIKFAKENPFYWTDETTKSHSTVHK